MVLKCIPEIEDTDMAEAKRMWEICDSSKVESHDEPKEDNEDKQDKDSSDESILDIWDRTNIQDIGLGWQATDWMPQVPPIVPDNYKWKLFDQGSYFFFIVTPEHMNIAEIHNATDITFRGTNKVY